MTDMEHACMQRSDTLTNATRKAGIANVVLGGIFLALLLFTACCWIRRCIPVRSSDQWCGRHRTRWVPAFVAAPDWCSCYHPALHVLLAADMVLLDADVAVLELESFIQSLALTG